MHVILATLLIFQQQLGRGYWIAPGFVSSVGAQEWEYHAHSSVCGIVWKVDGGWDYETLKSGGARVQSDGDAETFGAAKSAVEEACK